LEYSNAAHTQASRCHVLNGCRIRALVRPQALAEPGFYGASAEYRLDGTIVEYLGYYLRSSLVHWMTIYSSDVMQLLTFTDTALHNKHSFYNYLSINMKYTLFHFEHPHQYIVHSSDQFSHLMH
jgi:hypothetical protein